MWKEKDTDPKTIESGDTIHQVMELEVKNNYLPDMSLNGINNTDYHELKKKITNNMLHGVDNFLKKNDCVSDKTFEGIHASIG